jgi:hypothetical protein
MVAVVEIVAVTALVEVLVGVVAVTALVGVLVGVVGVGAGTALVLGVALVAPHAAAPGGRDVVVKGQQVGRQGTV